MKMKKVIASILVISLCISFFASCKKDSGTTDPTAEPSTTVEDAALAETFVGKIGEEKLYTSEFNFFLYSVLGQEISTMTDYPTTGTEQEVYDFYMSKLFDTNGQATELCNTVITETIKQCQQYTLLKIRAFAAGFELTEEKKTELNEQLDSTVDSYLSTYGASYGVTTRDDILKLAYGYKVNDYKRYAAVQTAVSSYSEQVKSAYQYAQEDVVAFYNKNISSYKKTKLRYIYIAADTSSLDSTSETYEADKAALVKASQDKRDSVLSLIKQGTALDNVAKGFSDSTSVTTDLGVVNLSASETSTLPTDVVTWALAQTEATKIADTKVIEVANDGYYIVLCEGFATYDNDSTIKDTVLNDFLTEKFVAELEVWVTLSEYTVTDIDNATAIETIKTWAAQILPKETATPTATPAA